jgi:amino acid adenylation domain-containing protein
MQDAERARRVNAPEVRSIPERISLHAAATPNRVAVVDEDGQLTYEELERESSRLAARLREAGARPERSVGLLFPRSAQFVVAALAVLKSGAAYVPLDPATPADRVSFMLADAGVVALLAESRLAKELPKASWPVIADDGASTKRDGRFTFSGADLDTLACIIYTSGSTGQPKGVEITHANLCNLIEWHQATFDVTAKDRASHVAGLGFDATGWEIWPYLTAAASVHIADESTRRSPEMLRDWLVAQKITIAFVPTLLAEQLFRADWPAETALRTLLTGGDTLERRPPAALPFVVVNNYGPTECTVVATSGTVSAEPEGPDRPSIGRPITNATALILDPALRPVAPGEAGELCISGALVGRGYRNTPELTASRFVTYIAASGEPLRIYRTGDRVRSLENGELEFLGRFDDQVKIRGYRIELGEIVACLNRYPGIEASTVLVSDVAAGGPSLVAYVVPAADARLAESELRQFLAAKLPDYMLPAFFISIHALPVMANGKLDKSALPAPCADNLLPKAAIVNGPLRQCSAVEEQIAELVASLMSRPSIGPDENFFMAGGHSMFGVQLVARIRDTFGVKLTLRQLFKAPTIAALSAEVARLTSPV